ncbi:MAG: hypothetical protein RBS99_17720 [Rhodospirillales bacterium]|jgi:hypothetical protein|nr:hypothetical protein [Rhodospirillales bacterium]
MLDEMEWLDRHGWEPVHEPSTVARCRMSVVAVDPNAGGLFGGNPCRELRGLLNRIEFEDYVLNDAVRRHIRMMLDRLSDDEFEEFCNVYEKSLANDD